MNLKNRNGKFRARPQKYDLHKAAAVVRAGQALALSVGGPSLDDDDDLVGALLEVAPAGDISLLGGRESAPGVFVHFRYEGWVEIGANHIADSSVDALVDAIVATADNLDLIAGVIEAHELIAAARARAIAMGTEGVPDDVAREVGRLWGARWDWGPYARPPGWGTFLARRHADVLGGPEALIRTVQPYRLIEKEGFVFLQLTPYAAALGRDARQKLDVLEALMAPAFAPQNDK